jgi:hypothetical protein
MITKQALQQLQQISKANHWDAIFEVGSFNGRPVYQLRDSRIPKGARVGDPHLFSLTATGSAYQLDDEQTHKFIVSYEGFRKRIQ